MGETRLVRGPVLLVVALAAMAPAPAEPPSPAPRTLQVLSDRPLPGFRDASDVRWATDRTLYLAVGEKGVVEMGLDSSAAEPIELIAGRWRPGGFWNSNALAVSSDYLAAAAPGFSLTWRKRTGPSRKEEGGFDFISDIDAWDDRLLILAARREGEEYSPDGGIAWLGSLAGALSDLRPVLYDARERGARNLARCTAFELGKVRFRDDGAFYVVPGVQPGVFLFGPDGKLIHTWDTAALGLDSDCASLGPEAAIRLGAYLRPRFAWIDQRQVVDEVLPLREGPGLVVRRVEEGVTRWRLLNLHRDGATAAYELPIEARGAQLRLQGDLRGGRLALLVSGAETAEPFHRAVPRLVLAEVPEH